jgi:protein-disulfide isomerase
MNVTSKFQLVSARRSAVVIAALAVSLGAADKSLYGAEKTSLDCRELDSAARQRIVRTAARQLRTEPAIPTIDREARVPETCYLQIFLSAANRKFTLYVSPDLRFLSTGLWDLASDPEAEDARTAAKLKNESVALNAPARGPVDAAVTMVAFSDFQCPYCSAFARNVAQYQRAHPDRLRVVFRNFPLDMHPWAEPAARAGICITRQSSEAFWRLHDTFYRDQKSTSLAGLDEMVKGFVQASPDLDAKEYDRCMSSDYPSGRLDQDLAAARVWQVHATPTVFINGRRYAGFANETALVAALEQAAKGAAAPEKEGK